MFSSPHLVWLAVTHDRAADTISLLQAHDRALGYRLVQPQETVAAQAVMAPNLAGSPMAASDRARSPSFLGDRNAASDIMT